MAKKDDTYGLLVNEKERLERKAAKTKDEDKQRRLRGSLKASEEELKRMR